MFAMFLKSKLFSLAYSNASAKLIGHSKCVEGYTYAKYRQLLEGIHIVDWPFQIFDIESRCMINLQARGGQ